MGWISSFTNTLSSKISLFAFAFLIGFSSVSAQDIAAGETIFKQSCTACHAVDRQVIGPALKDVEARWSDRDLLKKFILNSSSVIKSGDKYSVEIFEKYNKVAMPAHNFSDEELENLLAYIKAESVPKAAASAEAVSGASNAEASSSINNYTIGGLIILIIVLIVVVIVLNRVIKALERLIRVKNGEIIDEVVKVIKEKVSTFRWILLNKKKVFFIGVFVFIIGSVWAWDQMWNIGIHQGYTPTQPINFSHELHAGINQINCQYCHSGAYKSKNASIPSANVCMNCHSYVQATEKYDGEISPEIKKIYAALDYNPETRQYGTNQKPIEWVRIHNLPDFAYFNHSQHVSVAGVECQKCHGPIETMAEVEQFSPLTMKWCINCHKETEVNHQDNAYYDKILAAHEEIKQGKKVTAAALGGLECVKCHY